MTMYFYFKNRSNTTAAMSAEAASSCANSGTSYARANSIIAILDTIAMVSIFVALVLGLSVLLVCLLGLSLVSIILVCLISLLVVLYHPKASKEQPQPVF